MPQGQGVLPGDPGDVIRQRAVAWHPGAVNQDWQHGDGLDYAGLLVPRTSRFFAAVAAVTRRDKEIAAAQRSDTLLLLADLYQDRDPEKAVEYRHQAQQIRRT